MLRARRLLPVGVGLSMVVVACQLIVGVDDDIGVLRPPANDARVEAGPLCPLLHPPPKTSGDTGSYRSMQFAIRRADVFTPGYDLDNYCTLEDAAGSPCIGSLTDGDGGTDNALGLFLGTLPHGGTENLVFGDSLAAIDEGRKGLTVVVYNWGHPDGGPEKDDGDIQIYFERTQGMALTGCDGGARLNDAAAEIGGKSAAPFWDGCDRWISTHENVDAFALSHRTYGYVSNNVLVAGSGTKQPNTDDLQLEFGNLSISIRHVVITAELTHRDNIYRLENGIVAGRVEAEDIAALAGKFSTKDIQGCDEEGPFNGALDLLCSQRDLPAVGAGPDTACTALSLAFTFEAEETQPLLEPPDGDAGDAGDAGDPRCPPPRSPICR